jgi:hypothetical protein
MKDSRIYKYLFTRKYFPAEHGYRMEARALPDWMQVTITETDNSKQLAVQSRLHVNKNVNVGPSYSTEFSDREILIEQSGPISHRFL